MSEIEILKGNKLIRLFEIKGEVSEEEYEMRSIKHLSHFNNLDYHKNWRSLMPVVLKISRLHSDMNCKKMDFYLLNMSICSTIDMVWDGVIEFIQWYNTQTYIK